MNSSTTNRKRGKPVVHPPVLNIETGKVYRTFKEAAEDICGDRSSVRRVCEGIQEHCHGYHFRFVSEEDI